MTTAQQTAFRKFIINLKKLLEIKGTKLPSTFISYAWEVGEENESLQKRLAEIQSYLTQVGIDTFLDTKNMQGDMRECMREIAKRDYIITIGTPRYRERAEQDLLYVLDNLDVVPPISANAVLLCENSDQIKFVRGGKIQPVALNKTIDTSTIRWLPEPNGAKRAVASVKTNQVIEECIKAIGGYSITNVAFELGLILDKLNNQPRSVLPLILKGDFISSFPSDIRSTILVRDFSNPSDFLNLVQLNPLGLIPAMCPELAAMQEYADLVNILKYDLNWNLMVWREQALVANIAKDDSLYILGCGDNSPDCKHSKPLSEHINNFLETKDANVLLLLGASGTGKSMFARHVAEQQWNSWQDGDRAPILVNLPTIIDFENNLMHEALQANKVPESHFDELRKQPILLILDGYDERNTIKNLYESNKLNEWNIKVIITCRPENLGRQYKSQFKPQNSNLWELYIAPFTNEQIDQYIKQYVEQKQPVWPGVSLAAGEQLWEKYRDNIKQLPGLTELIQTPFLLRIAVETLPTLMARHSKKPAGAKHTLGSLYEAFLNDWFIKHIDRWKEDKNIHLLDEGLREDSDDDDSLQEKRVKALRDYSEELAFNMFTANIDAVPIKAIDQFPWIIKFFDNKPRPRLIRNSCPIILSAEDFYAFVHKSILEFLVTPKIQQEILQNTKDTSTTTYLSKEHLNHSPAVIRFLADAIIEMPKLQECLWQIIESSKEHAHLAIAAANAATILNAANISFAGRDLSHTKLSGADLSHGIFEGTNFFAANLNGVNFKGAWLKNADLRNAKKEGVYFGERPYISLNNKPVSCTFSADKKFLIISDGNNISLFDPETHTLQASLSGHSEIVLALYAVASRNRLISASADKTIKIWDLNTKSCIATLAGHQAAVKALFYDVNYSALYSASADGEIKAWNLTTNQIIYTTTGHIGAVNSISLDTADNHLISAGADGTLRIWNATDGAVIDTFENAHYDTEPFVRMDVYPVTCVIYHEQTNTIISGGIDKKIKIWNKHNKNTPLRILKDERGHTSGITSLTAHPNGDMLLSTADWDRTARLWLIASGSLLETFEGHVDFVTAATFDPDQLSFVTVSNDKTVRFWEMSGPGINKVSDSHTWSATYVAYDPSGQVLASSSWDKTVKLWDLNGRILRTLRHHQDMVRSVAFSRDGKKLASASDDSMVRIWDPQNGELIKTLDGHTKAVKTVAFHPFANILASGSLDCTIRFWNLRDFSYKELSGHTDCVREIFFNNDGSKLVSASQDSTVRVWDTETKAPIYTFSGQHKGWVRTAAFHPNGKDIVSAGSNDKQIIVWDSDNGSIKYRLNGHEQFITAVSFSPDGNHLLSVGMDNKLLIWNPENQKVIFKTCSATPYAACWGIQGKQVLLATANADNAVRSWKVNQQNPGHFITLLWSTYQATLCTEGALVDDKSMSLEHLELFRQRGMNQITENNTASDTTAAPLPQPQRTRAKKSCEIS